MSVGKGPSQALPIMSLLSLSLSLPSLLRPTPVPEPSVTPDFHPLSEGILPFSSRVTSPQREKISKWSRDSWARLGNINPLAGGGWRMAALLPDSSKRLANDIVQMHRQDQQRREAQSNTRRRRPVVGRQAVVVVAEEVLEGGAFRAPGRGEPLPYISLVRWSPVV